jgi:DNA-binding HxlR family transcriptional regulator
MLYYSHAYIVACHSGQHLAGKCRKEMTTNPTETTTSSITQMCPRYEHAIQLLGKRWTGLILDTLMGGPRRFCELTASVEGLSDRVLSDRLRELELEGVIERVVYPQIPVRVEYRLTEKGHDLKPVVDAIHIWAQRWIVLPQTSTVESLG